MKAGILTFSNALNPGAVLQAFSLYSALEEAGHEAALIDYRCPAIEAMHAPRPVFKAGTPLKARVYNIFYNTVFLPRRLRYRNFIKRMRQVGPYTKKTIAQLDGKEDLFITGSDQVFNLKLTGFDTAYYLDFVTKGKKTSFAAGAGTLGPEDADTAARLLSSFDHVSVREEYAARQLEKMCGVNAEVVPDPVFLHSGEEWKKLLNIKEDNKEKYVLIYSLYEMDILYDIAALAAKKYGLKTVLITRTLRPRRKVDEVVKNAGPREFLSLIANASYVVTNSFHGSAFSVIFGKSFNTFVSNKTSPWRIEELLEECGVPDRAVRIGSTGLVTDKADAEALKETAGRLRRRGLDYLEKITKG